MTHFSTEPGISHLVMRKAILLTVRSLGRRGGGGSQSTPGGGVTGPEVQTGGLPVMNEGLRVEPGPGVLPQIENDLHDSCNSSVNVA